MNHEEKRRLSFKNQWGLYSGIITLLKRLLPEMAPMTMLEWKVKMPVCGTAVRANVGESGSDEDRCDHILKLKPASDLDAELTEGLESCRPAVALLFEKAAF